MKKSSIKPLNGLGDLAPSMSFNGAENEQDGLGIISDILSAAEGLTSLLIHVFKKPPADTWSVYSGAERTTYVKEALQMATTSVITGRAVSITNVFRKFIARVAVNRTWEQWKKRNVGFLPSLFEASMEVEDYKKHGYRPGMEYINPQMIDKVLHPAQTAAKAPATAAMFGGGNSLMMLIIAVSATALIVKILATHNNENK
jgi:hypothetical protein